MSVLKLDPYGDHRGYDEDDDKYNIEDCWDEIEEYAVTEGYLPAYVMNRVILHTLQRDCCPNKLQAYCYYRRRIDFRVGRGLRDKTRKPSRPYVDVVISARCSAP